MNILDTIGNTPIVKISDIDTGPCELYLKLESQNPGGSIKDRIAVSMINDAEKRGVLAPGATIIEATAGNTGIGLALVGSQRGYQVKLVVPDKMSRDKIYHLQSLGAEVVLTRSDVERGHPEYYHDLARSISQNTPNSWLANQFSNRANPLAHETSTGPEIWEQMDHKVDAIVVGVGSGGTLGGLTKYFSKVNPGLAMIIADPEGSVISPYVQTGRLPKECGSWLVEGIGEDFLPDNADFSMVKASYPVSDKESFLTAREILKTQGILGGSSSGTLIAAALRYCKEQKNPKRVLTFVCDTGTKYLSKMYSDFWMAENGFIPRQKTGDLRDLIARPNTPGALVSAGPNDKLQTVYSRMKMYDFSQIPVLEGKKIVGIVDESDILFALQKDSRALSRLVKEVMTSKLKILQPADSLDKVIQLLKNDFVAIIADTQQLYGIVTFTDVIDFLRLNN